MAAGRTLRSLVSRRRRADDEGEDEDGPVFVEDSQSEGSVLSEPEDEDDVDVGSTAGQAAADAGPAESAPGGGDAGAREGGATKSKKAKKRPAKKSADMANGASSRMHSAVDMGAGEEGKKSAEAVYALQPPAQPDFKAMADTEAMMNGLQINDQERKHGQVADFEDTTPNGNGAGPLRRSNGESMSALERQRREHEEYRKKRDSNPAFIPNRGNFFMHDTRGQNNGPAPPIRGAWQGRGRGRVGPSLGGPFSPAGQTASTERAAEQPWKHDLHDTINEEPNAAAAPSAPISSIAMQQQADSARLFPKTVPQPSNALPPPPFSFDSTTLLGKVQVRVFLPGMTAPAAVTEAPVKRYVRLPNHRAPLRRDKPVRISIPGVPQRYQFPAPERSFVFIPRQMRPNQQGFHRGYQRSIGGGYGYSSRRTSMHGSLYSGSVAPSRRSSMAGISRDRAFSPASFVGMPPSRPIVRLPHGSQPMSNASTPIGPLSGYHTPTGSHQIHMYPLPQMPQFQGTPTDTMHQPRPQKTISVTGIESPAAMLQNPVAEAQPQPFQNQLPAHMNEAPAYAQPLPQPMAAPYYSPRLDYQYPAARPPTGTPLSAMPEQAVHAPAFHPPGYGHQPYYQQYPPASNYYYSPPGPNGYAPPQMPMYMMPQQNYMLPPPGPSMNPPPPAPPQPPPQQHSRMSSSGAADDQTTQSGMVAHESNGMVFYVPAAEAAQSSEHYQPAEGFVPSYAMPGLPPPTPAPDTSMQYYYPSMPQVGMQEAANGVYYPAQQ